MKKTKQFLAFLMSLFLVFSVIPGNLLQVDAAKKKTVKVKTVKINKKSVTMVEGDKITLKATLSPKNTTQKKLVWSTSNKKVATVTSKGVVNAKKKGKATITVKVKGTSKKATCKVTVKALVKVKKITLNKTSISLQEGTSTTLKATLTPKNTTQKTLQWSTSDKKIATVSSTGVVKAVKKGTATITVKVKGTTKKATCKVTVKAKPQVNIKVTKLSFTESEKTLAQGDTYQTKLNIEPSNATQKGVTYTSSNATVATVDANGKVTAKAVGDATITATAKDGSGKEATMNLHVEFAEVRYVLTYNKNYDVHANMIGDNRRGDDYFCVEGGRTYYCYNRNISVNYKEAIVGDKEQQIIRVLEAIPGSVFFEVNAFSEGDSDDCFTKAEAQVEVWQGNKKVATYNAPSGADRAWLVSAYTPTTGEFTEYNQTGGYGLATEAYYGDLDVTGWKDSRYIDSYEKWSGGIEIYTSIEDFYINPQKYVSEIVPIYSNPRYTYEISVGRWGDLHLTLKSEGGKKRTWDISVEMTVYKELEITKCYAKDGSITYSYIRNTWIDVEGVGKDLNADQLVVECVNPKATYEISRIGEYTEIENHWEILVTHPNGTKRTYYLSYSCDYLATYPELKVVNIKTEDNTVVQFEHNNYSISVYLNKEMNIAELKDKLQIELKGKDTRWEWEYVDEEENSARIRLIDSKGNSVSYYFAFYTAYETMYGDLRVSDIQSTDRRFLSYEYGVSGIWINGTAGDFEDIKDSLQIACAQKGATCIIRKTIEDEEDSYEILLTGTNGQERSYEVFYYQDLDAKYCFLEALDITDSDSILTAVDIRSVVIYLDGGERSMETFLDKITVKIGEEGATYKFIYDGKDDDSEYWALTLTGADGTRREYQVVYSLDVIVYYGDLCVKEIQCEDGRLTDYTIGDTYINLYGTADDFAEIKDSLSIKLADETAKYKFTSIVDEEEGDEYWKLVLTDEDGKTRTYNIDYEIDYDELDKIFEIENISSDDIDITKWNCRESGIDIFGLTDTDIENVVGKLKVTMKNSSMTTRIEYSEDWEEWILLITGTDGSTRKYSLYYCFDYDTYYGNLKATSIKSSDGSRPVYEIDDENIWIWGIKLSFEEMKDLLTVVVADKTASADFVNEGDSWKLKLKNTEGKERIYSIRYYCDYSEYYKNLYVEDVTSADERITLCTVDNADNLLEVKGIVDDFGDVKDALNIVLKDKSASYTFLCDVDEDYGTKYWKLVLTGADKKERIYEVNYYVDYEVRAEFCAIESVESEAVTISNWEYDGDWLNIYGMEDVDLDDIVENLTVTLEKSELTTKIEYSEDSHSWNLVIKGSDGFEARYFISYICE